MRIYLIVFLLLATVVVAKAQEELAIKNFVVKENLLQNNKLALIATDSLDQPKEYVNGTYNFSVNGFKQELKFNNGVAVCDLEIEKSSFVYIKHQSESNTASKLYYIIKSDSGLDPIKINPYLLLLIPAVLIFIGYLFRKLIGLMIFVLLAFLYFNHAKGLSLPTFLESVFDSLRNMI